MKVEETGKHDAATVFEIRDNDEKLKKKIEILFSLSSNCFSRKKTRISPKSVINF